MNDSGAPAQENGVTGQDDLKPYFGPATRDEYGPEYQIVATNNGFSSNESNSARPSKRKRQAGEPAFLIQGPGFSSAPKHRLGAILTILHEIPLARNTLLKLGEAPATYGHNSLWWTGQGIVPQHQLEAIQRNEWQEMTPRELGAAFNAEVHRLMAFLDLTDRSYGSVGALADQIPTTTICKERQFYDTILEINGDANVKPLCTTAVMTDVKDDSIQGETAKFG
jgi:hypothetical protein